MRRDGDERPDVLEFGTGRGRPKWVVPLVIVALVAAAVVVWRTGHPGKAGQTGQPGHTETTPPAAVIHAPTDPSTGSITQEDLGGPLLGVTTGWELFGRGAQSVVRIEPARGRVTRTAVTPPASSGPVSFVVGRTWAVVRPLDVVPGTVVADDAPPRPAAGALGDSGPAFPGPDPDHLWAPAAGNDQAMSLVGPDGRPTGTTLAVPDSVGGPGGAEPDGTGYLLLHATGGTYLDGPGGLRRITTGDVLAAGPTRWLTLECDDQHRCAATVVDRSTGARQTLPGLAALTGGQRGATGLISPDGAWAAVYEAENGSFALHLIRLSTGTDSRVDAKPSQDQAPGGMVWSPDGRWLFVVGDGGRLVTVDAATCSVVDLGVDIPGLQQVAIRPAAAQK